MGLVILLCCHKTIDYADESPGMCIAREATEIISFLFSTQTFRLCKTDQAVVHRDAFLLHSSAV